VSAGGWEEAEVTELCPLQEIVIDAGDLLRLASHGDRE
jgi:hypothetical protein